MPGDPLEGLSLPPGEPEALLSAVASFSRAAEDLDAAGERQHDAVGQVSGATWKGAAAESARSATGRVLDAFRAASSLATDACGALSQCVNDWQNATDQWHQARYLADQALVEEAAVVNAAILATTQNPKALDYQSPYRDAARKLGQEAIDRFNAGSQRAASTLDHLGSKVIASPAFLPVHHSPWYDAPVHWGEDAVNAVGGAFSTAWDSVSSNPAAIAKDALGLLVGAGLTLVGGAAVGGGGLLDATGVLLPAGVPLTVAGAAAITAGVGGAGYYGDQLIKDLGTSYARKVAPDEPGYGATPEPGEGTPVGGRPYDSELASRVPPWGVDGTPTTSGLLDVGDGDIVGIASGRDNLANEIVNGLPKGALDDTGMDWYLRAHVEAQAAIYMRLDQVDDATLYINREMCTSGTSGGCAAQIGNYLRAGQRLTLYGPNGGVVIEGSGPPIPGVDP